mmetsp:Transcript_73468/g.224711  ORF Transcript_73468/g.224711 Transcript_73468/m.224711 type:complete len:266 (+) Transcript_73468:1387-2184(+)
MRAQRHRALDADLESVGLPTHEAMVCARRNHEVGVVLHAENIAIHIHDVAEHRATAIHLGQIPLDPDVQPVAGLDPEVVGRRRFHTRHGLPDGARGALADGVDGGHPEAVAQPRRQRRLREGRVRAVVDLGVRAAVPGGAHEKPVPLDLPTHGRRRRPLEVDRRQRPENDLRHARAGRRAGRVRRGRRRRGQADADGVHRANLVLVVGPRRDADVLVLAHQGVRDPMGERNGEVDRPVHPMAACVSDALHVHDSTVRPATRQSAP